MSRMEKRHMNNSSPEKRKGNARAKGRKKQKKGSGILGNLFLILVFVILAGGVVFVGRPVYKMYRQAVKIVDESDKNSFKAYQTSIVYDVNGDEIKKLKGEKDVHYVEYDDISDAAKLATISIEDKNFTKHHGVDVVGLARSVVALIVNRGHITMGGSTITQQLAKNMYLSFQQTYSRKVQEIFLAYCLEQKYSKEEILEFYLNNVYFANGYYGIEAASEAYFNKSNKELTISQTAFLCAIPNSPTRYDPYVNPDATLTRRDRILKNMYEDGYISKEQYENSLAEEITVLPKKEMNSNDYAETYILKCATEALMEEQGFEFRTKFSTEEEKTSYQERYNELYQKCKQSLYISGYRIYTSIDMTMQEQLQESISRNLGGTFTAKTDDGIFEVQGAGVCIDNKTGRVSAIVGGREEDQEGYGLNRAYQANRQPGSAIKPLVVYAPAFEEGYTPDSIVDDSRMTGTDKVNNAGYVYMGRVSLRKAVQKSSNVATYRLYQELGPEDCLEYLEKMNFAGLDEKDYEYDTTCIGGFTNGTTPVEMAAGYATLANDGIYRTPTCIIKITDSNGKEIVKEKTKEKSIYSSNAARTMTDVLETCVTAYGATATGCKLDLDIPVACKTGTTSNYVDGWLCGYSPYYTTAIWVGMDVYKSVDNLKGNTYPAYIWKDFMDALHENVERDEELEGNFGLHVYSPQQATSTTEEATTEEEITQEEEDEDEDQHQEQIPDIQVPDVTPVAPSTEEEEPEEEEIPPTHEEDNNGGFEEENGGNPDGNEEDEQDPQ